MPNQLVYCPPFIIKVILCAGKISRLYKPGKFKSTKSVVFDKQANIDEIDALMEQYKKWEEEGISKK